MIQINNKILKFLMSGGTAAATEFVVFAIILKFIDNLLISNSVSFLCGLVVSYTLNRLWVFDSKANVKKQFSEYFILATINLGLSNLFLYFLTDIISLETWISKIIVMATIACSNYFIFSKFIFKK